MAHSDLHFAPWRKSADGTWLQVIRVPAAARLHIPAEDGRVVDGKAFPQGGAPWGGWLRVSCMAVEMDGAAVQISLREPVKSFTEVRVERDQTGFRLILSWRAAACAECPSAYGPPQQMVREHTIPDEVWQDYKKWMDRAWPQKPFFSPDWVKKIPSAAYVELWSGSGKITHTFQDLLGLLEAMHRAGVGKNCLLYFWGFHAPFDTAYPDYWPATELGGEDGLARVIDTAQRFGYRLMPHLNYWGCDARLPIYARFRHEQVRDRNGNPQGWRVEGEPPIEYIRPGCREWREHMAEVCQRLVTRFPFDALFFDQLGNFVDDPGCDFETATQLYSEGIQQACPGTVLAGEIFHERCRSLPLWQVWGTPWCGLPVREDLPHAALWRPLFADRITMVAHMGMPAAVPVRDSWPAYYWYPEFCGNHQEAVRRANAWHRAIGAVPCVRVNFREFGLDETATATLQGLSKRRRLAPPSRPVRTNRHAANTKGNP